MSSGEPDPTTASDDEGVPDPHTDPQGAVDALEKRQLDDDLRPSDRADDGTEPAFDVDLDPEDQGRADTGAEQTG